jgi:membrane associated rhomboid family serine protease
LDNLFTQFELATTALQQNAANILLFILALYAIHLLNALLGKRLALLGIYPRKLWGIVGIPFHPFIHGDFNHLFFNSIPLFILACFVSLNGWPNFFCVTATIVLLGGTATWLLARRGFHIGASGLVMGYWSYLLANAYQHPNVISIVLVAVCLYYFGGLAFNLFPMKVKSSWESHVFGFLAGFAANYTSPWLLHYLPY